MNKDMIITHALAALDAVSEFSREADPRLLEASFHEAMQARAKYRAEVEPHWREIQIAVRRAGLHDMTADLYLEAPLHAVDVILAAGITAGRAMYAKHKMKCDVHAAFFEAGQDDPAAFYDLAMRLEQRSPDFKDIDYEPNTPAWWPDYMRQYDIELTAAVTLEPLPKKYLADFHAIMIRNLPDYGAIVEENSKIENGIYAEVALLPGDAAQVVEVVEPPESFRPKGRCWTLDELADWIADQPGYAKKAESIYQLYATAKEGIMHRTLTRRLSRIGITAAHLKEEPDNAAMYALIHNDFTKKPQGKQDKQNDTK